jgi:hypothetical protein
MSDARFYGLMFELYRQADYLRVRDLTTAIIKELKERLGHSATTLFFRLQLYPEDEAYKKAYEDPMKAAVFAYDKSNVYYDLYEPARAELLRWIEHCYPVLCRLGDDFDDYLREAPELGVTILKTMRNIESSRFISPGPDARCMFCDGLIWQSYAHETARLQPMFGVVADRKGHVRYFCHRPSCYRKITIKRCFKVT